MSYKRHKVVMEEMEKNRKWMNWIRLPVETYEYPTDTSVMFKYENVDG